MIQSIINWLIEATNIPAFRWPEIGFSQFLDVSIIAVIVYLLIRWIKRTQAWVLMKGIAFIAVMALLASIFNLSTVQWIIQNTASMGLVVIVILFQPELRKALEQIGRGQYLAPLRNESEYLTHSSAFVIDEIIKAAQSMGAVLTGALIVMEQNVDLSEHETRGTPIDAQMSSRLLMNIFEKNAPLHDGAVIVRGNRISSAGCILPLTDESVDSALGTRHRAAIGVSQVSDARVVVVSEETGTISIVIAGKITRDVNETQMREMLMWGEPIKSSRFALFNTKRIRGKKRG